MSQQLRYKSSPERREALMEIVSEQGFSSTSDLMQALGVSDMTIRRDAQMLADQGRLRVVYGGVAALPGSVLVEYEDRARQMASAKRAIGRAAAAAVAANTVIAIDAGTTALEFARALPPQLPVTVVTQSAPVVTEVTMKPTPGLIVLGGSLHRETLSFEGSPVIEAIKHLHIDSYYLTASGVNDRGLYCANDFDAVTKRALIAAADKVVFICDSSKFHKPALVRICGLDAVNVAMVDAGLSAEDRAHFIEAGLHITTVEL